ncbi:MAG TPA: hypothetical protein VHB79_38865 [Polyangiaceae bacterium]|nr:hypothetical protein [Polyangiaceae bacterium]
MATKKTVSRSKAQGTGRGARAKAHDRRGLTQAARQEVEGKVARDYLGRLTEALEKAAPKPQPIVTAAIGPDGAREMLAAELHDLVDSLGEALGDIIEAHMEDDSESFGEALRRVNSARVVLQGEAAKLKAVQP